jgi:hypothetical protein
MSMQVDDSPEAPEADDPSDATAGVPALEDGEPTSFAEKTRDLYERHKPKIYIAGAALAAVLLVAANRHKRQGGERNDDEDAGDWAPGSDREILDGPRRSAPDPDRDPFLRRLPAGQNASEDARERCKELTGNDLPPGYTLVRRWLFLSPDDEDPGETAAY